MAKIRVNQVELYYEIHGEGPPLLCLSGFTADHLSWTTVLERFKKHFQVILIDNRGIGSSEVPEYPYTIEMMAADTLALMDALDLEKVHLMGHSMGGMIAMSIVMDNPERVEKLLLCHSIEKTTTVARLTFDFIHRLLASGLTMKQVFPALVPWLFSNNYLDMPGNLEMIFELNRKHAEMSYDGFKNQLNAISAFDARALLGRIRVPTFIIAGENDLITPPGYSRIMKRVIPGAQLSIIPAVGHMGHIEKPELFSEIALGFLLKN